MSNQQQQMQAPWAAAPHAVVPYQNVVNPPTQFVPQQMYVQPQPQYIYDARPAYNAPIQQNATRRSRRGGKAQNQFIRDEIQKQITKGTGRLM